MIYDNDLLEMNRLWLSESWISKYYDLICNGLWHLTSPRGILGIKRSGFIEPNCGNFQYTLPQSKNSYGKSKKYVCLFDFFSANDTEIIYTSDRWIDFFRCHKPFTVALKLNRKSLAPSLISNDVARQDIGYRKVWIPYVESWYPRAIEISEIVNYFVIPFDSPKLTEVSAEELMAEWINRTCL